MKMDIGIKVMQEVLEKMHVEIEGVTCTYDEKEHDIYVRGGVRPKQGFKAINGFCLKIKADITGEEGEIFYTLKDYSAKTIEKSGYDSFDMSCMSIDRFIDIKSLKSVNIYAIWEKAY